MHQRYRKLASERAKRCYRNYTNPEDHGFNFKGWITPYTKSAHAANGYAVVLQDWGSEKALNSLTHEAKRNVQRMGYNPDLLTNKRLSCLLAMVLDRRIEDIYVTNAFPFIKKEGASARIPIRDIERSVAEFTLEELKLAGINRVFVCGNLAWQAMQRCEAKVKVLGLKLVHVPHPAARFNFKQHLKQWHVAAKKL